MPIKLRDRKGKIKYRSFNQSVGDFKRRGYSEKKAKRITAKIQRRQERFKKRKSKRK